MSANIYVTPVKPIERLYVECMAPSHFISNCEKIFGGFPLTLTESSIPKLETMEAITGDSASGVNIWSDLIEKIRKFGAIKVWAEY